MKKIIIAIALIGLSSCTTNEDKKSGISNDCNCGQVVQCTSFNLPTSTFTVLKVKNNCTGEVKTVNIQGTQHLLNTQYCN